METLLFYILPNIVLFGSIIGLSKFVEYLAEHVIFNYADLKEL